MSAVMSEFLIHTILLIGSMLIMHYSSEHMRSGKIFPKLSFIFSVGALLTTPWIFVIKDSSVKTQILQVATTYYVWGALWSVAFIVNEILERRDKRV